MHREARHDAAADLMTIKAILFQVWKIFPKMEVYQTENFNNRSTFTADSSGDS